MKKSLNWKSVLILYKFFANDSLHGLFQRQFFKKRINRYLLFALIISCYFAYFYFNMLQLGQISKFSYGMGINEIQIATKLTISSYTNMTIIFCILIFVFVHSTIALTKNSLYFAKTLPFSTTEVNLSHQLFSVSIGLGIYELVLIIVIPLLKVLSISLVYKILLIIAIHLIFISLFLLLSYVYSVFLSFTRQKGATNLFLDILLFALSIIHLYKTRFLIDNFMAKISLSPTIIIIMTFIISIVLGSIAAATITISPQDIVFQQYKYIKVASTKKKANYIWSTLIPIIRSKEFIYFIFLELLLTLLVLKQTTLDQTLQNLTFVYPLLGISAIVYADGTFMFRQMYKMLRFSEVMEGFLILFSGLLLMIPSLIIGIAAVKTIDPYLFAVCIYLAAIISGLLFPKNQSNLNETVSVMLTILIMIVLTLVINIPDALYPTLILLMCILHNILRNESKVLK